MFFKLRKICQCKTRHSPSRAALSLFAIPDAMGVYTEKLFIFCHTNAVSAGLLCLICFSMLFQEKGLETVGRGRGGEPGGAVGE